MINWIDFIGPKNWVCWRKIKWALKWVDKVGFKIILQEYNFKTLADLLTSMISSWRVSSPKWFRTPARTRWWERRSSSAWRSSRQLGRSSSRSRTCSRRTSLLVSGKHWPHCFSQFNQLNSSYHWPNGVLYYTIDAAFDSTERATIAAGMKMVEDNSCIRFFLSLSKPSNCFAFKICCSHKREWLRGHHPWRRGLLCPGSLQDRAR